MKVEILWWLARSSLHCPSLAFKPMQTSLCRLGVNCNLNPTSEFLCQTTKKRERNWEVGDVFSEGGSSRMKADRSSPSCGLTHVSCRASERCSEVQALPTSHLHLFTSSIPHRWSVLPWPGCSSHSVVLLHLTGRGLQKEGLDLHPWLCLNIAH